ncbi:DUF6273 domain-containing protein [Segatella hominis]|uniref:DUF6273 domain-containing protein n=1 Tax=Segatella hominis TaxID=2518605 RepID=UPI003AB49D65
MQIKDLAIGDGFVYLMEGSTKVKFYVLAHNYESGLNGKGRTLFCRESPAGSGTHTTSAKEDYRVDSNNEDAWYKNTYVNKFSGEVRKLIGMTKYIGQYVHMTYTQSGNPTGNAEIDSETYESSFFPLSTAEVALRAFADGSALSSAAISRIASIQTRYGSGIWTRSPSRVLTGTNSTGFTKYYYANSQYISGASGSSLSTAEGTPGSSYGYLPCFTLPETLYIDKDGFATENQLPEVSSDAGESGVALGEKNAPFTVGYTVTDGDGDHMRIVEKVNGVEMAVREKVASGTELTVQCLSEKALFQQILNGENTLTLEVDDGKTTTEWTATFTKNVTSAVLSLTAPLTADDTITVAALTLEGSFPADMSLTVEMTNNALDDSPVWENCTDIQSGESRAFIHHAFTNKTAARGFAFNYKVTVARGESGVGGTITIIGGVIG